MDYRWMTAPCGLDCFNCPMYMAGEDERLRRSVAEKKEIAFEKAICRGCRNEGGAIAALDMTQPCKVYRCVSAKGIDFCCDCPDFPCDYLHPYADMASEVAHNTKVFNLCLIRKMGLESWARSKAERVGRTYFNGKLEL